jgi:hypothetical protein
VNRRALYLLTVTLIMALAVVVNSIWYANRVGQRSDEKAAQSQRVWCSLIDTLDDTYQGQPPTTPTGQQVAAEVHALRLRLGC